MFTVDRSHSITSPQRTAAAEWRAYWTLPAAAAFGYSVSVLPAYGMGPFIVQLQHEFGWSRSLISLGLTIVGGVAALFSVPVGMLVDRLGPRRIALTGVPLMTAAFALLGASTGSALNWLLLWTVVAFAGLGVQTTVWTSVIPSRFEISRGLAIAITVSGSSVGATLFPVLASWLNHAYGWRYGFAMMGAIWGAVVLPVVFLFFDSDKDHAFTRRTKLSAGELPGVSVPQALRSLTLYKLMAAAGFMAFTAIGVVVHFVPILTDRGATALAAGSMASLIGISSIAGRIGTGLLLDRFPAHRVGAGACLSAVVACMLLVREGAHPMYQAASAICIGLTMGAEVDVVAYLAWRHFGYKNYGVLFGAINGALALGVALGPIAAGAVFDRYSGYTQFLVLAGVLMAANGLSLLSLPRPVFEARKT